MLSYDVASVCHACLLEQEGLLICKTFDHGSYMEVSIYSFVCS